MEFEVKNEGAGVAQAVEIDLSGHAAIVGGLKNRYPLAHCSRAKFGGSRSTARWEPFQRPSRQN